KECRDSWFLYDCRGCSNCFMCWNLRNKQYCIKNKQYSREEYERIVGELALGSRARIGELDAEFWGHLRKDAWHRASININTENCSGNYLTDSKGCGECYFLEDCEDDAYAMRCPQTKDCMDCSGLFRGEKCYEVSQSTDLNNVKFSIFATDCSDCFYVDQCVGCRHCFGCVGLKRREYCILNKQFSREEYEEIVEKLTEKMREEGEFGEMLPYRFAYNGFNLSLAAFYCDVPEGAWLESEPESEVAGVDGRDLADAEFGDDALNLVVNCAETGRPYKFVKHELDFYRRLGLSLPALYPEQRNKRRFGELMGLEGRMVKCAGCSGEVVTYWQEDKGFERIFCEACYLKEVY
ncbi:hypothetical protein KJ632_00160, partial [Patescibacteria group bacterium]|nr:hypothetical protein [Patescibacteria group bacterium]